MKKLLGLNKDKAGGKKEEQPPPPPARLSAAPPPPPPLSSSSPGVSSRSLETDSSAGNNSKPAESTKPGIPPRHILEHKLREFYLEHEPRKADDLEKVLQAVERNGLEWLQDGLRRKYNGDSIDFDGDDNGHAAAPPPRQPPSVPKTSTAAVPPPVPHMAQHQPPPPPQQQAAPAQMRFPGAIPMGGGAPQPSMFGSGAPPPNYDSGAASSTIVYPNAATALKSKGLGKYVAALEDRGIVSFEDLAKIEENPADSLWATMPPIPDKKNMRALVQSVKDYVAWLGVADASMASTGSTPFDDHPDIAEAAAVAVASAPTSPVSASGAPEGAFQLPPNPRAPPPRNKTVPLPPVPPIVQPREEEPEPEAGESGEDVDEAFAEAERLQREKDAAAEEEERQRIAQEEADAAEAENQKRREEEQQRNREQQEQERKRRAEAERLAEEEERHRKETTAVAAAVAKPPPPPKTMKTAGTAMLAVTSMKRKQSDQAIGGNPELEQAEKQVAELKHQMEEQTNKVEEITAQWERLTKELDEVQAKAEQEKDKLDDVTGKFTKAKEQLDKLRKQAKAAMTTAAVAAPQPPPPPQPPKKVEPEPVPADTIVEEPPIAEATEKPDEQESLVEEEAAPHVPVPTGVPSELAQEASHVKLRSTTGKDASGPREKTAEACDHFELDMKATTFGQCRCGHLKTEHKQDHAAAPAFQTNTAASRFAASRASAGSVPPVVQTTTSPAAASASTQSSASFAARGNQYPALDPCDNYQLDVSASAFGTCICGHLKTHHMQTSPAGAATMTRPKSNRDLTSSSSESSLTGKLSAENGRRGSGMEAPPPPTRRPSVLQSQHSSSSVGEEKRGSNLSESSHLQEPTPPAAAPAPVVNKPPPPARRPSVLASQSSSKTMSAAAEDNAQKPSLERVGSDSSNRSLERRTSDSSSRSLTGPPPPMEKKSSESSVTAKATEDASSGAGGGDSNPHRVRLLDFYTKYNPEKVGEVDTILQKFKGKETVLFKKLKEKYPDAAV